jgi:hypothetical protein
MAEWLFEDGIGERRALLVAGERILAAEVERDGDGARVGSILLARLVSHDRPRRRARIILPCGAEAWLTPAPAALTEGASLLVRITRMAMREAGRDKPAQAMPADALAEAMGPDLHARIMASAHPVTQVSAAATPDRLEAARWSELTDSARTGIWPFAGGALAIALTPAMTLIDIDGDLPPAQLAEAGARAAMTAITALGISGSIGIDFPTLSSRAERLAIDALIDAALEQPFERTAINGFGFVQIIRRRERPSLAERLQYWPAESDALALLRLAERAQGAGPLTLTARQAVVDLLAANPPWIEELQRRTGRPVTLHADATSKGIGHAQ